MSFLRKTCPSTGQKHCTCQELVLPLLWLLVLLVVAVSPAVADERLEGKACRSVHLQYPAEQATLFYNEVAVDQSAPGTYFCVCGFRQGYFGIQELYNGKKVVIFSVWDPGKQNDPNAVEDEKRVELLHQGEGVRIKRFGNEGTGGQAMFDFDWQLHETYRLLVKAQPAGDRTSYSGYIWLGEQLGWKHLVTFSTLAENRLLAGYYSFVEDFRRNGQSTKQTRRAQFGNGWVKTTPDDQWQPLLQARFTADRNPVVNINAGIDDDHFYLATGGDIANEDVKLNEKMKRRPEAKPEPPQGLP